MLACEWPKLMHVLRCQLRKWFASWAQKSRLNLEGLEEADLELARALTKQVGSLFRGEMIAIGADAIWTNQSKAQAKLIEKPGCYWSGECEDVPHILFKCKRWEEQREKIRDMIAYVLEGPPCERHCLIPRRNMHPRMKKRWGTVQLESARILKIWTHARQQFLGQMTKSPELPPGIEVPSAPILEDGRPLRFHLQLSLQRNDREGKSRVWPLTREAWWKMNAWAAQLMVMPQMPGEEWPMLIEALISFILWNNGDRLETGVADDLEGARMGNQLAHFRSAVVSFQNLADSEILLSDPPQKTTAGTWVQRVGLERQIRLSLPIVLPNWAKVRMVLASLPEALHMTPMETAHGSPWRHWVFGGMGSQVRGGQKTSAVPLWRILPRRVRTKMQPPPWVEQCREVRRVLQQIQQRCAGIQIGGQEAHSWLEARFGVSVDTIKGIAARHLNNAKRALAIYSHNEGLRVVGTLQAVAKNDRASLSRPLVFSLGPLYLPSQFPSFLYFRGH